QGTGRARLSAASGAARAGGGGGVMAMSQAIHVTAGNHAGPKSQRGLERYLTPSCAVEALVAAEPLPQKCWEPCGGDDENIAIVLRSHRKMVVATDIDRDGIDFRDRREAPPGAKAIVTNPPFSLAADFRAARTNSRSEGRGPRTHSVSRERG